MGAWFPRVSPRSACDRPTQ